LRLHAAAESEGRVISPERRRPEGRMHLIGKFADTDAVMCSAVDSREPVRRSDRDAPGAYAPESRLPERHGLRLIPRPRLSESEPAVQSDARSGKHGSLEKTPSTKHGLPPENWCWCWEGRANSGKNFAAVADEQRDLSPARVNATRPHGRIRPGLH